MKPQTAQSRQQFFNNPASERRGINRIPLSFSLIYSGTHETNAILGNGTVVDMSREGLGIRGDQPVASGMDLTLLLSLSDKKNPLFVIQARVAWVNEHRFGLSPHHNQAASAPGLQRFLRSFFYTARASGKA